MQPRPAFIDFRSNSHDTMRSGFCAQGQPSPRIAHYDGEIPPAMSPLDAFAAQSRLLAKQLDDSKNNGRRASRLPPLTIANSLAKSGMGYAQQRAATTGGTSPGQLSRPKNNTSTGSTPDVEEPVFRPKSVHPRMSGLPSENAEDQIGDVAPSGWQLVTPGEIRPAPSNDYFTIPRTSSPEPLPSTRLDPVGGRGVRQTPWLSPQRSFDSTGHGGDAPRSQPSNSPGFRSYDPNGLAPPMSPLFRQTGSIRSMAVDSSDDDLSASTGGSSFSQPRKLSSSSGMSMPQSPLNQLAPTHARSPSLNSEYSIGGSRLARPAFNFSRPLSRSSRPSTESTSRQPSYTHRPSFDTRSRQPSSDSQRFEFSEDMITPMSMEHEHFHDSQEHQDVPAPSYIYAKYSLPRGRMLQREKSKLERSTTHKFEWEQSPLRSNVIPPTASADARPISPAASAISSSRSIEISRSAERPSVERDRPVATPHPFPTETPYSRPSSATLHPPQPIASHPPPSATPNLRPAEKMHPQPTKKTHPRPTEKTQPRPMATPISEDKHHQSSASMRSNSTIKAQSTNAVLPPRDINAEEHLAKGIQLHEGGSFKESTYHLRIAAKQGLPTAMLLYALACRHGWGMRPNPEEGVEWLRKAADSASLEVADDENPSKPQDEAPADLQERKTRRAQFALSIYELGVSHMNGWGVEMDKPLALRCFEIAASWGDADAMAEAGFCYAQGRGCKKDLNKAARYYRMAEAKGISMVGNSWFVTFIFIGLNAHEGWKLNMS